MQDSKLLLSLSTYIPLLTEAAARSTYHLVGRGDQHQADQAAVDSIRTLINTMDVDGLVTIGEGERDQAPMLYIGEKVGTGRGPSIDIALDPLDGTALAAEGQPGALSAIAASPRGGLLNAPDIYMDKITTGPDVPPGAVSLKNSARDNIHAVAEALGKPPQEVVVCLLKRPRHEALVSEIRACGARVLFIMEGDIEAAFCPALPSSPIDMYMGTGAAPEGVLAAAALSCLGGFMEGRLVFRNDQEKQRAHTFGLKDSHTLYTIKDMVRKPTVFSATGITGSPLLRGVSYDGKHFLTETLVMDSLTGIHEMRYTHCPADEDLSSSGR